MQFIELVRATRISPMPLFASLQRAQLVCTIAYWQYHYSRSGGYWRRVTFIHKRYGKPSSKVAYQVQEHIACLSAGAAYVNFDRTGFEYEHPHFSVVLVGFTKRPAKRELIFEPERDASHPFVVMPVMTPPVLSP